MRSIDKASSGRGLTTRTVLQLTDELQGMGNDLKNSGMAQLARIHGDLNLSNVLVASDGKLFLIDFGDTRFSLPLEDFVSVWHTIWSLSRLSRRRRLQLDPCLARLVEEYSSKGASVLSALEFRFLRRVRALIQVLVGVRDASRYDRFGMQANKRLADVSRRWLEEGCPTDMH